MSFGIGHADYKRLFATEVLRDASVLVLHRSMTNRLRSGLHRGFCHVKNLARKRIQSAES